MRLRYFVEMDINDRVIEAERDRTMTEEQRLLPPAVIAEMTRNAAATMVGSALGSFVGGSIPGVTDVNVIAIPLGITSDKLMRM